MIPSLTHNKEHTTEPKIMIEATTGAMDLTSVNKGRDWNNGNNPANKEAKGNK
jgi:hypothetical protein